jgi:signal transduction histidine kinase
LTVIAILMAAWILRAIVRSVDSLSEDAEVLGLGKMPVEKERGLAETDFVATAMRRTADLLLRRTAVLEQVNHDNLELQRALSRELEAKSRSEAELERKVEERTASLRQAVGQMEEFSYTVSHDLRGPLRALQGYAEILLEDYRPRLDEIGQDYLLRIQRAAVRMDQLTTDVLDYSRLARTEVSLAPTDLDKILRKAIEHYDQLQRSGAAVKIESPLAPVMAHEPALLQCLSNLLTNAVKFVKPGQVPVITIRTESRAGRVRLWVEDQGIGIAPEYQPNLFRLFERLPTAGRYEGTGIGLAIVRKGAEKMGGTCGVVSDGVSGSRFWIELAAAQN